MSKSSCKDNQTMDRETQEIMGKNKQKIRDTQFKVKEAKTDVSR